MKLEHIVLGYDGSANADMALEAAISVAREGTTIHLVTAYHAPSSVEVMRTLESVPAEFRDRIDFTTSAHTTMDKALEILADSKVKVQEHLLTESPAAAILRTAEVVEADLIVVGSRGLNAGQRFLRGSVSTRVANHARTNVLVVHERFDKADK